MNPSLICLSLKYLKTVLQGKSSQFTLFAFGMSTLKQLICLKLLKVSATEILNNLHYQCEKAYVRSFIFLVWSFVYVYLYEVVFFNVWGKMLGIGNKLGVLSPWRSWVGSGERAVYVWAGDQEHFAWTSSNEKLRQWERRGEREAGRLLAPKTGRVTWE